MKARHFLSDYWQRYLDEPVRELDELLADETMRLQYGDLIASAMRVAPKAPKAKQPSKSRRRK